MEQGMLKGLVYFKGFYYKGIFKYYKFYMEIWYLNI